MTAQSSSGRDICAVSGTDRLSLRSPINHKIYCNLAGYDYRFEAGPFGKLANPFLLKQASVRNVLPRYDWVIWLDDDAFFTGFESRAFDEEIAAAEESNQYLIIGDSPVNARGESTMFNAGVLALRNDPRSFTLLEGVLGGSLDVVRPWWDTERFGKYCNGDQDLMVHWLETHDGWDEVRIVPHQRINARTWEYRGSGDEHAVCHFPGVLDKRVAINRFAASIGRDDTLVPPELLTRFGIKPRPVMRNTEMRLVEWKREILRHVPVRA